MVLESEEVMTVSRETLFIECYEEVFPKVAKYIRRKGGDLEQAKEIFQEALVLYYEKLVRYDFDPEVGDKAYLMGMVKKRWLKHLDKFKSMEDLERIEVVEDQTRQPLKHLLLGYLKQSGERCMELLQSFYYEKLTMRQVANRFGYASERSATVQKYKCLEKVRNEVKQRSLNYEDFFE